MAFFDDVGKLAIGSRVRLLAEVINGDALEIYKNYDTNLNPKWFPVFYVLSKTAESSVTAVAEYIGHSHASASKIVAEMAKAKLIIEKEDVTDRRRTLLKLSKRGQEIAQKIETQYLDVNAAIDEISSQATHNLWEALAEWEYLLKQKSLLARVEQKRKERESADVKIVSYKPKYQNAFRQLNEQWIEKYFKIEQPDRVALNNPEKYVIDKGGAIFVALLNDKPVGVCALLKRDDLNCYELAKMAVSPDVHGKGIGFLLAKAVIEKARKLKADRLFLESNTILKPAIRLYEKLGFKKIVGKPSPYERANIQMELLLN